MVVKSGRGRSSVRRTRSSYSVGTDASEKRRAQVRIKSDNASDESQSAKKGNSMQVCGNEKLKEQSGVKNGPASTLSKRNTKRDSKRKTSEQSDVKNGPASPLNKRNARRDSKTKTSEQSDGKDGPALPFKKSNKNPSENDKLKGQNGIKLDNVALFASNTAPELQTEEDDKRANSTVREDARIVSTRTSSGEKLSLSTRLNKLSELKRKRIELQKSNREEVRRELSRSAEPKSNEARYERLKEKAEKLLEKKRIEDNNLDYERVRSFKYTAEDVEVWNEKQEEAAFNANNGFTDYIQVQSKKYRKLVSKLQPNLTAYRNLKKIESEANEKGRKLEVALLESRPTPEAIETVVQDLNMQEKKRATFSRRRMFDPNDDVDYINERNMRFNNKIARAYDKYTAEIRANFERGTAIRN